MHCTLETGKLVVETKELVAIPESAFSTLVYYSFLEYFSVALRYCLHIKHRFNPTKRHGQNAWLWQL